MKGDFLQFVAMHRWRILLVALGIAIVILFFTIGFFKTLLIAAVVALCYFLGPLVDKGGSGSIKAFFKALFKKNTF